MPNDLGIRDQPHSLACKKVLSFLLRYKKNCSKQFCQLSYVFQDGKTKGNVTFLVNSNVTDPRSPVSGVPGGGYGFPYTDPANRTDVGDRDDPVTMDQVMQGFRQYAVYKNSRDIQLGIIWTVGLAVAAAAILVALWVTILVIRAGRPVEGLGQP